MDYPLGQVAFKKWYIDDTAYSTSVFYFLLLKFEDIKKVLELCTVITHS